MALANSGEFVGQSRIQVDGRHYTQIAQALFEASTPRSVDCTVGRRLDGGNGVGRIFLM